VSFDEFSNYIKFLRRKSTIFAKKNWLQPKFTDQFIPLHMDVFGFTAIKTVKEKVIRARNIFYRWHIFTKFIALLKK